MSLAAIPAYFLARRVLGQWLRSGRGRARRGDPVDGLHGHADDRERLLPDLPHLRARPRDLARAPDGGEHADPARPRLARVPDAPAGDRAPARDPDGAAASSPAGEAFRRYRLMYAIVAAGVLVVVVEQVARGRSRVRDLRRLQVAGRVALLGRRGGALVPLPRSELDLSLGVLPFAALLVLALGLRGLAAARQKIFVAASLSVSFWLVLEVAAFASEQSFRVEERNMFYVAPLFLIALLVWIDRGLPRRQRCGRRRDHRRSGPARASCRTQRFIGLNADLGHDRAAAARLARRAGARPRRRRASSSSRCAVAGVAVPVRACAATHSCCRCSCSSTSLSRRHRSRPSTGSGQLEALFGGISRRRSTATGSTARSGAEGEVAAVWTGDTDKFTDLGERVLQPERRHDLPTGPAVPGGLAQTPVTVDGRTGAFSRRADGRLSARIRARRTRRSH